MVIIRSFFVLDIYPKNGGPGGSRTRVRNSFKVKSFTGLSSLLSQTSKGRWFSLRLPSLRPTCFQGTICDHVYFGEIKHLA